MVAGSPGWTRPGAVAAARGPWAAAVRGCRVRPASAVTCRTRRARPHRDGSGLRPGAPGVPRPSARRRRGGIRRHPWQIVPSWDDAACRSGAGSPGVLRLDLPGRRRADRDGSAGGTWEPSGLVSGGHPAGALEGAQRGGGRAPGGRQWPGGSAGQVLAVPLDVADMGLVLARGSVADGDGWAGLPRSPTSAGPRSMRWSSRGRSGGSLPSCGRWPGWPPR